MGDRRVNAAALGKRKGVPFPVVTAYDAPFARFAETAGIDVLLVGDTLGMVVLGYSGTAPVDLIDMERHAAAVVRGTQTAHVIVDMPFGSYEADDSQAVKSAARLVKRTGASSVKLEGGVRSADRIRAIVQAGIPVVGHIGVLPQTASLGEGFRRRTVAEELLADARAVQAAGAFAVVLEMVGQPAAREITAALSIVTIGIGSGPFCDAQVLVTNDFLGMFPTPPPFVRKFAEVGEAATEGFRAYAEAVRSGAYPPRT